MVGQRARHGTRACHRHLDPLLSSHACASSAIVREPIYPRIRSQQRARQTSTLRDPCRTGCSGGFADGASAWQCLYSTQHSRDLAVSGNPCNTNSIAYASSWRDCGVWRSLRFAAICPRDLPRPAIPAGTTGLLTQPSTYPFAGLRLLILASFKKCTATNVLSLLILPPSPLWGSALQGGTAQHFIPLAIIEMSLRDLDMRARCRTRMLSIFPLAFFFCVFI
nr:hypothetical protein CFP56_04092 [Quercus suber]